MRAAAVVLLALLAGSTTARAQCCLGAQDVTATSAGGRYEVKATSLTGTGPSKHGPYRYRFQWSTRDAAGALRPGPAFERTFETTAHFRMQLFVSPTGNGFLLSSSIAPDLVLLAPTGEPLVTLDRARVQVGWGGPLSPDGFHVTLWSAVARPVEGGGTYDPVGALFLPFGAVLEGPLREQLLAALACSPAERATRVGLAGDQTLALEDDDASVRERAGEALRALGPFALAALEASSPASDDARAAVKRSSPRSRPGARRAGSRRSTTRCSSPVSSARPTSSSRPRRGAGSRRSRTRSRPGATPPRGGPGRRRGAAADGR